MFTVSAVLRQAEHILYSKASLCDPLNMFEMLLWAAHLAHNGCSGPQANTWGTKYLPICAARFEQGFFEKTRSRIR